MGALRQSRSFNTDMSSSNGQSGSTTFSGYPSGAYVPSVDRGLPTLIVMIVVLLIIVAFCFWGAPAVREFCRRKICCCCPMDEPTQDNGSTADGSATPTIILLPYGRMLVVDRSVFAQLQADHTGIDFMELSANLIRAQRLQNGSNPSILESEATSKGLSPTSIDFLPPAYEDIFGTKTSDLPPSYSEISIMFRKMSDAGSAASGSERSARLVIKEDKGVVSRSGGTRNRCFLSTPTLRTSTFSLKEDGGGGQLKARHGFASLENNIERQEADYKGRRRSAGNNGSVDEMCAINKRHESGPKEGNCRSPERDGALSGLKGGGSPEPCNSVQYLQSCHKRRASVESRSAVEYLDRESTV